MLSGLTHTVECCDNGVRWEVIAAFNCEPAAMAYGGECHMVHYENAYRVREIVHTKTTAGEIVHTWGAG